MAARRLAGMAILTALALVLAACGVVGGDVSTIEVRPRASLTRENGLAGLTFRIGQDEYVASDYAPDEEGLVELSRDLPNSGIVGFGLELRQRGALVAQGEFNLKMRRNFEWGMDIFRQVEDPTEGCFGCEGVRRFEIAEEFQNEPGEAVWIAWGGQERGSDIVY